MEIGTKVVVFYTDDDVWHERLILLPSREENTYWIITPDGDIYEEDLGGKAIDGPDRVRVVPPGVRTLANLRRGVYRFREDPTDSPRRSGKLGSNIEAAMDGSRTWGFGCATAQRNEEDPVGSHSEASASGKGALRGSWCRGGGARPVARGTWEAWVVIYSSLGRKLGDQVSPATRR